MNVIVPWMMFHLKKLKYRMASTGPATSTANPINCGATNTRLSNASWRRSDSPGRVRVATAASAVGPINVPYASSGGDSVVGGGWRRLLFEQRRDVGADLIQRCLDLRSAGFVPDLRVECLIDLLFHGRVIAVAVLQLVVLRSQRLDHRPRQLVAF